MRNLKVAACVAATVLAQVGCGVLSRGHTEMELARPVGHPNQAYNGLPGVSSARHAVVGDMIVCTESSRPAHITSVTPLGATGTVTVVDVRTRSNPFLARPTRSGIGAVYGSLAEAGMRSDTRVILPCKGSTGAGSEVALELSIMDGTNAAARAFRFTVTDGRRTSRMTLPLGVVLCSTTSMDAPACDALSQSYGLGSD